MPGLLIFTASEQVAKAVEQLCANSGWMFRRGETDADLDPGPEGALPDAMLVDLVSPVPDAPGVERAISSRLPFMPLIFIAHEHAAAEHVGGGLRYYVDPAHVMDLEHLFISICCGFPSGVPASAGLPDSRRVPRVLIVDDNLELAHLIERSLRSLERFDVRVTSSGFEAASILPMFKPDVLVIDLVLDDMDGREVCAFIRSHESLGNTRIVGVSGYLPENCALNDGKELFDMFLEKPFRVKDVVDCVVSLLQK